MICDVLENFFNYHKVRVLGPKKLIFQLVSHETPKITYQEP
jgi:hypothetical protein